MNVAAPQARPALIIATPCFGGTVTQGYMESVLSLLAYASDGRFSLQLSMLGHDSLITRARNTLVAAFMDQPAATHLLFIDADIAFDPAQVERMLAFDQDIVAGVYPLKTVDWERVRTDRREAPAEAGLQYVGTFCAAEEFEERDGFVTAEYGGTGFMLIRRAVIEQMIAAYPETRYDRIDSAPQPKFLNASQYALFDCMIDRSIGTYLSEDFTFCQRWRKIGGKIWLDTRGRLTHIGTHEFRGNPGPRFWRSPVLAGAASE